MVISELESWGFRKSGEILLKEDKIGASFTPVAREVAAGVYVWLHLNSNSQRVIYAGLYGRTVRKRFGEHVAGFHGGSQSGVKKASYIRKILSDSHNRILLYSKASDCKEVEFTTIRGEKLIRRVACNNDDESDLIEYYGKPPLNTTLGTNMG